MSGEGGTVGWREVLMPIIESMECGDYDVSHGRYCIVNQFGLLEKLAEALGPWTILPEHRPTCPADGRPCTSWTCLVEVCVDSRRSDESAIAARVDRDLIREILEALCRRDGLGQESRVAPGEPARNYELADRLGIGEVFGMGPP